MKILGGILLAVGILIAGGSGLCSLVLFVNEPGIHSLADAAEVLSIIGFFGGIPFAFGTALALLGYWLVKRAGNAQ
jgi:hypothetical protein